MLRRPTSHRPWTTPELTCDDQVGLCENSRVRGAVAEPQSMAQLVASSEWDSTFPPDSKSGSATVGDHGREVFVPGRRTRTHLVGCLSETMRDMIGFALWRRMFERPSLDRTRCCCCMNAQFPRNQGRISIHSQAPAAGLDHARVLSIQVAERGKRGFKVGSIVGERRRHHATCWGRISGAESKKWMRRARHQI